MRITVCFIMLIVILTAGTAAGAPVGNIADPSVLTTGKFSGERAYGFIAGIETEFVSNRSFTHQDNKLKFNFYGVKAGTILKDNLFIYTVVGMGEMEDSKRIPEWEPDRNVANVRIDRIEFETDSNVVFGFGITALLYEYKIDEDVYFRIGLDVKYRRISLETDSAIVHIRDYDQGGLRQSYLASYATDIDEYQGALAVSYQYENFAPYIGYKISDFNGDEKIALKNFPYENIDYSGNAYSNGGKGLVLGLTYYISNTFSISIEGRERDEEAFNITAQMRF
ncbi:MAG: hypothetical protein R6X10_02590 [Desulfobacterales bacterium]